MNRLSLIRYTSAVALGLSTLWSAAVCAAEDAGAFDKIQQIRAGDLNIGYVDIGPRDGQPVILLHGWPYDIQSYAQVAPALAQKGYRVIVPYLRGYGTTRFLSASTPRNGQPSAMAADIVHLMDALNIRQADLAGFDWGARTADIVAALWPQRVKSLVSVSGYLISSQQIGEKPLPPQAELSWWYQFYLPPRVGRPVTGKTPTTLRNLSGIRRRRSGNSATRPLPKPPGLWITRTMWRSPSATTAGAWGWRKGKRSMPAMNNGWRRYRR